MNIILSFLLLFSALRVVESRGEKEGSLRRELKKGGRGEKGGKRGYSFNGYYDSNEDWSTSLQNQASRQQQHPCMPYTAVPQHVRDHQDTDENCFSDNYCSEGCCRVSSIFVQCSGWDEWEYENERGMIGSTFLPCICNMNTGGPEDYENTANQAQVQRPSFYAVGGIPDLPEVVSSVAPEAPVMDFSADVEDQGEDQGCIPSNPILSTLNLPDALVRCESNNDCNVEGGECCVKDICYCANRAGASGDVCI